jgi:tRNA nucleotidyltransferase (CCA-adding enzyme)
MRSHKEFATAKIIYSDGFKVDIASARLEYYKAPAALPIVEHSSLKLDLHRRDFTINTLAISLNKNTFGELIDFFGAQRDIKEKTIRVLHSLSFVEDPTRVFRAIRFEIRFGFKIGKHTLDLIKNAVRLNFLAKIRGKRIWTELALILQEGTPEAIIKRLEGLDLLKFISGSLIFNREKEKLFVQMHAVLKWHEFLYQGKAPEKLQYYVLGLIDHMKHEDVLEFCKHMEMSERTKKKIIANVERIREAMAKLSMGVSVMKKSAIHRTLEPLSREAKLFIMARTKSEEIKKAISGYITNHDSYKPFTTGEDIKKLGIQEGPIYKEVLETLKDAKIDMNLKTKEEESHFVDIYLMEKGLIT